MIINKIKKINFIHSIKNNNPLNIYHLNKIIENKILFIY